MQQKIQFICTIIHEPEMLILDEPFSGFDPVNAELIKNEILRLKSQGTTIILSTHRMESVEELCDNFSLINKSRKVIEGSIDEVRHKYRTHTYEIVISGVKDLLPLREDMDFHLKSMENPHEGKFHVVFKVGDSITTNDVIQKFLPYGDLELFREILPGINDIFIELVGGKQDE